MFRAVYILATSFCSIMLVLLAPVISKLRFFTEQRKDGQIPKTGPVKYWIHAASLGEYEMAIPLIERLLESSSPAQIIITIFSPSGYTQAIKGRHAARLMYLPLDTLVQVRRFYKDYNPQKAIFIRYDFWYNFISEGLKNGTQFYLVNGRFQEDHFFFKWYGKSYLKLLSKFKGIYTSDQQSEELLKEKGVPAEFAGDSRFDRVSDIAQRAKKNSDIEAFINNRKVLMLGSSWEQEEELLAYLLTQKPKNLAVIVAPHDIKRSSSIANRLAAFNPKKYTDLTFSNSDQVLILDTIGMLSSMYQYADFALIGGGFSGALHNILEPAVWGCYLSFGPKTDKFPEAQGFVEEGFAWRINSPEEWTNSIIDLLANEKELEAAQLKAKNYCRSMKGSTSHIIDNIG